MPRFLRFAGCKNIFEKFIGKVVDLVLFHKVDNIDQLEMKSIEHLIKDSNGEKISIFYYGLAFLGFFTFIFISYNQGKKFSLTSQFSIVSIILDFIISILK